MAENAHLFQGFRRKEFRGKLAIAITVNFINRHSEAESHVEEISGVAFIFNQKFFNDLNDAKGIMLENIVYYRVRDQKQSSLLQSTRLGFSDIHPANLYVVSP